MSYSNGHAADTLIERIRRHPKYYLTGGDVHFLVDNYLFRVHRYFFERESAWFREKLAASSPPGQHVRGSSEAHPFLLEDVAQEDFARFLWVFYNPKYSIYDATVDDWKAILKLAYDWRFSEVKKLCARELEKFDIPPVPKIELYQAYDLDKRLLIPSYIHLCIRPESLSVKEGRQLGLETALLVATAREAVRNKTYDGGVLTSSPITLEEDKMIAIIRDVFGLTGGPSTPMLTPLENGFGALGFSSLTSPTRSSFGTNPSLASASAAVDAIFNNNNPSPSVTIAEVAQGDKSLGQSTSRFSPVVITSRLKSVPPQAKKPTEPLAATARVQPPKRKDSLQRTAETMSSRLEVERRAEMEARKRRDTRSSPLMDNSTRLAVLASPMHSQSNIADCVGDITGATEQLQEPAEPNADLSIEEERADVSVDSGKGLSGSSGPVLQTVASKLPEEGRIAPPSNVSDASVDDLGRSIAEGASGMQQPRGENASGTTTEDPDLESTHDGDERASDSTSFKGATKSDIDEEDQAEQATLTSMTDTATGSDERATEITEQIKFSTSPPASDAATITIREDDEMRSLTDTIDSAEAAPPTGRETLLVNTKIEIKSAEEDKGSNRTVGQQPEHAEDPLASTAEEVETEALLSALSDSDGITGSLSALTMTMGAAVDYSPESPESDFDMVEQANGCLHTAL
ncbi:uncharacterized protein LAESUDRAFT_715849 [Laetiporus sulphureus 93-53]|uniref:BTB domain-containing protein n=1 Tax=Laetiporus sulphureus 93-53 TaxID=1314785 RepID=A0A165D111_9APHY|nr:uncharacterized protein LAESUDRAFT_715849 [Laetiporus sulphureus 93-53]KZT03920.1 hypothetical protein LAESUDRAFT_715849 [Laetiporus sulphureus 93-53]